MDARNAWCGLVEQTLFNSLMKNIVATKKKASGCKGLFYLDFLWKQISIEVK